MAKQKQIQIPEALFYDLCRYHLTGSTDPELPGDIRSGLQAKMDALIRRELYSQYKDKSLSDAEREAARQAYLDAIGMRPDFRWDSLNPPT